MIQNPILFSILTAFVLGACDPSINAVDPIKEPYNPYMMAPEGHPFFPSGMLPNSSPPREIADLQVRVIEGLKVLPDTAFDGLTNSDKLMVGFKGFEGSVSDWQKTDTGSYGHLVIRHLEQVRNPKPYILAICKIGKIYSGFAGPEPYTYMEFHSESMKVKYASPYGLIVCERGEEIQLTLISAKNEVFQSDAED